jgi:hypothetical protein
LFSEILAKVMPNFKIITIDKRTFAIEKGLSNEAQPFSEKK